MKVAKQIINSSQYQSLVDDIQKRIKLKILNEYRDTVASRDEQKMKLANLSGEKAMKLLETDKENFSKFALCKMQKFENAKIDEEYPIGEEPEQEDDNEMILGYSKSFLLLYLIEYYLLKTNPSELETYLKATRIPYAKKYEKELKKIYSNL
ncbi:hypothetical protein DKB58_03210 [Capnocytophaga canimorsus]|uniref:hypothetical protein n=1 Tax=Capnocytophaga canimorsus TaxID=28188 RepID=UPI000D6E603B|nr:hypothetical protein [Capnocytophaga canimorsus]AWL78029.1 hypothetical protein DKB58_03210 [Capnocytophaga canimorsus]MDT9499331.1 hypothetical protein [Capnocytophaga canimorsus]